MLLPARKYYVFLHANLGLLAIARYYNNPQRECTPHTKFDRKRWKTSDLGRCLGASCLQGGPIVP